MRGSDLPFFSFFSASSNKPGKWTTTPLPATHGQETAPCHRRWRLGRASWHETGPAYSQRHRSQPLRRGCNPVPPTGVQPHRGQFLSLSKDGGSDPATTRMDLEGVMRGDTGQVQKDRCCVTHTGPSRSQMHADSRGAGWGAGCNGDRGSVGEVGTSGWPHSAANVSTLDSAPTMATS